MEFVANLLSVDEDPREWALKRESEGWDVLAVADHLPGFPHVWVTLGQIAEITSRPKLSSAFANNLLRSPAEFAQASLAVQRASGGRFEAGLGAGWMSIEMTGTGREFPQAGTRVSMYIEAVKIARELIDTGSSKFKGRHYQMEIEGVGPRCDPPPELSAALGGPRMIREVTPLVDRVEVKGAGSATRGGALDFAALASIGKDDIRRLVDQVRSIDPEKPLSFFALAAAGRNPVVKGMESMLGDGVYGGLNGEPEKVATNLRALGEIGFERVNVSPTFPGTEAALAPFLFGGS